MRPYSLQTVLLWALLVVGVVLRFHALDRQSLWGDELSTLRTLSTPVRGLIHRFATDEMHPPLYFLQLRVWRAFHMGSLVKLRANSAFWGSLSLFLAYLLGRRYGGEAMGLLTLAFFALSPFHLAYSQELRPYALALTISLAALWTLEDAMAGKSRRLPLLAFLWTAQLYTHYWGTFVVLAQALYGISATTSPDKRKMILITCGGAGALFAPWVPLLGSQLGVADKMAFWVPAFSFTNLGWVYLSFTGLLFNMATWTFYLPSQVWMLTLLGFFFAIALVMGLRRGPRGAVIWLGVGLGVPWLLSLWKTSIFVAHRYPIHMFPAFVLLVAAGLLAVRPVLARSCLIVVLLGSQAWGDWVYFHEWEKANPRAVVQYVHWLRQPDTVVVRPSTFSDLFNFYDLGTTPTIDEEILDSPEKRAAFQGRNIILLAFDVPSDPIADALLTEYKPLTARMFPGTAQTGVTVYQLKDKTSHHP